MKNKLTDLNDHLFSMLEKLDDDEVTGEKLDEEINRAKAITSIAGQIINNANLALNAKKFQVEAQGKDSELPPMLED